MDEKIEKLVDQVEAQRDQIGRGLSELEAKVRRNAPDWRNQFDRNPMLLMGAALGGGLLLGTIVASSRKSSNSASTSWSSSPRNYSSSTGDTSERSAEAAPPKANFAVGSPAMTEQRRKAGDTLEMIKGALIAFGTAKVKEFMSEALPGFGTHLEEAQRRHSSQYDNSAQSHEAQSSGGSPGSYQGGSQAGTYGGGARTDYSSSSPYKQDPVGANPSRS